MRCFAIGTASSCSDVPVDSGRSCSEGKRHGATAREKGGHLWIRYADMAALSGLLALRRVPLQTVRAVRLSPVPAAPKACGLEALLLRSPTRRPRA
jgi:hypothetical protein